MVNSGHRGSPNSSRRSSPLTSQTSTIASDEKCYADEMIHFATQPKETAMRNSAIISAKPSLGVLFLLGLIVTVQPRSRADLVLTATEVMIEETTVNVSALGFFFGVDPTSPLSFTTFVAPSGLSYSYSAVPGTTYLGQNLSLAGTGTLVASGSYHVMTAGKLGDVIWSSDGFENVTNNPDGTTTIKSDSEIEDEKGKATGDYHYEIKEDGNKSSGTGYYTALGTGQKVPKSDVDIKDTYNEKTGEWDCTITPHFIQQDQPPPVVNSVGLTPAIGGDGTFTAVVTSVPEPSPFGMLLLTSLGFLGGLRLRRYARSAWVSR
jgi:hypothetical protein